MQVPPLRYFLLTSICFTAYLLPQDFQVVSGSATSTQSGNLTTIENSPQAILHWENFSIPAQNHLHFAQVNAASSVLNRVTGSNLSALMGTLTSNGQVYLINPSGILIGPNASIATAGFLASTANLSNEQFLAGEELLFTLPGDGKIVNEGSISCEHGNIFLIAKEVLNEGTCSADFIGIGSSLEVLIQPQGTQRLYIRPDPIDVGEIVNRGSLEAFALELKTSSAYEKAIRIEGSDAKITTRIDGGRIILSAENSGIVVEGSINAPAGDVQVLGKSVALSPTGTIDVATISIEATGKGIYLEGQVLASQGSIQITNTSEQTPFYNLGILDVSGEHGGSIRIDTTKLINVGKILADGTLSDGGSISIHTHGPYIETSQGLLSVSGMQSGGTISVQSDTTLFSSGTLNAQGTDGGEITLLSPTLTLVSAHVDASGSSQGGQIFVGGGAHGESLAAPNARTSHLSGDTILCASGGDTGGTVVVWSDEKTICHGTIDANGVNQGGWIEVSSKEDLFCGASLSASGEGGMALLDPKNIVIDAVAGVYPQYEFIDPNSGGGSGFGSVVYILSTGNVVISKPNDNAGGVDAGAVYLYNGHTAALISTLTGSTANDFVGIGEVGVLTNGNFVIPSPNWNNGAATNAGAATWGSGITGVSGVVSSSNSLVGTTTNDSVGESGAIALTNGNYIVASSVWNNGLVASAGAVTWGNGSTGITGPVTSTNSLVGTTASDRVGSGSAVLSNGNYVVVSSFWNNGLATTAGAITWGNGSTGITGPVTSTNSLVGTTTGDSLGSHGGTALTNGNYVVRSAFWDNGANANAGAVTWGDGSTGVTGAVSSSNSLVGTQASDFIGVGAITEISDGNYVNYVILNHSWNNGATADAGAVTWANGTTGITGTVSSSNSLVGTQTNDQVGLNGVVALANGNYVVVSSLWDNGATANAGAVTWGNGTTGISGTVSSSNSLVGTSTGDRVGISGVVALANGNYVVASTSWNNGGALEAGAATWGDGSTGVSGAVSSSNSLVGTTTFDGAGNVIALTNGNYVVISPNWDTGAALQAGAATWGNGTTGISGTISASNSLVGTMEDDQIGGGGVIALTNGNYVVISVRWRNGAATNAGAATWGDGTTGITGTVTSSNSLVGTTMNDDIGIGSVFALTNNNYVVVSPSWSDGATADVGAVTWGNGSTGIVGEVSSTNSLVGTQASDFVGFNGVTLLTNGNYVVNSNVWANGAATFAGAATWGNGTTGITGAVSQQNSIVGQVASSGFFGATEDAVNGTFICTFPDEGSGKVRVGLQSPNQIDFSRAQAQDMTITPSLLTDTLNTGTNVSIQANNDITISSAIASSPGAGALSLSAGRSAFINANITTNNGSLNITANDLLSSGVVNAYRDPGDAVLSVANGVTIDTGTGSLNLSLLNGAGKTNSGSGDLTIGDNATLQCSGSGAMTLTAQENNIALGNNSLLQTVNGTLMLSAGKDITDANPVTLQTTGAGELILITDSLFPTAPLFGNGKVTLPLATLTTAGGRLLIYTSQQSLNTLPATINGVPFVPGPEFIDTTTEKWGTYYPNSSGIPFTVFYKQSPFVPPTPPSPISPAATSQATVANQGTLADLITTFITQKTRTDFILSFDVWLDTLLFCDFDSERSK